MAGDKQQRPTAFGQFSKFVEAEFVRIHTRIDAAEKRVYDARLEQVVTANDMKSVQKTLDERKNDAFRIITLILAIIGAIGTIYKIFTG